MTRLFVLRVVQEIYYTTILHGFDSALLQTKIKGLLKVWDLVEQSSCRIFLKKSSNVVLHYIIPRIVHWKMIFTSMDLPPESQTLPFKDRQGAIAQVQVFLPVVHGAGPQMTTNRAPVL